MSVTIQYLDKTPIRLRLQINNPSGDNVGSIVRTDPNGTHSVRVDATSLPSTAASLIVLDYEYPLLYHATITYTVYSVAKVALGSLTIGAGHPGYNTARGLLALTVPVRPASGLLLNNGQGSAGSVVVRWDDTRTALSTVHQVVGRSDPIAVLRAAATRTGTLELACPDLPTAQQVQAVLAQPYVFALRQSDQASLDVYFVPGSAALTASEADWTQKGATTGQPERRWTVTVAFTEVAWPTGYVVPVTVWTWNDVVASYADWNAVAGTFSTWANVLERIPG